MESYFEVSALKNVPIFCDNTDCIDNTLVHNFINNLS